MKHKSLVRTAFLIPLLFLFLFVSAEETKKNAAVEIKPYFKSIDPDILNFLPPPPADGSPEQQSELFLLRHVTGTRTKAQLVEVESQLVLTGFSFSPVIGPWFKTESLPKTTAFFLRVDKTAKDVSDRGKGFWKRIRPYDIDQNIAPLKKEKSFSYPSGHSNRGAVYAAVLAELFPEKRDALLSYGFNAGWNRIVAGVHYPSDVFAGRILGMTIAGRLIKDPGFLKDLEEVRSEIRSVKPR